MRRGDEGRESGRTASEEEEGAGKGTEQAISNVLAYKHTRNMSTRREDEKWVVCVSLKLNMPPRSLLSD
eukprot:761032-Hanusia_phi.AAC.7